MQVACKVNDDSARRRQSRPQETPAAGSCRRSVARAGHATANGMIARRGPRSRARRSANGRERETVAFVFGRLSASRAHGHFPPIIILRVARARHVPL